MVETLALIRICRHYCSASDNREFHYGAVTFIHPRNKFHTLLNIVVKSAAAKKVFSVSVFIFSYRYHSPKPPNAV